jgi:hypothetical protein
MIVTWGASSDSNDDCFDPKFDPDGEVVDNDDVYDPAPFAYDVADPIIDVGVVFPDVDQCKSAFTHHAILNDHAFETIKKDQSRFRAKCKRANQGCKWTFFGSTSTKYIGSKVINIICKSFSASNYQFLYHFQQLIINFLTICCRLRRVDQSILVVFNNCGETMASNKWVAERVVESLREDPEKGPRDLHSMLQKKYSIDIPFHRVYRSKNRAMDTIYGKWDDSYDMLPTYQAELVIVVPGSIVELDTEKDDNGDLCFSRFFVALKPCIDGFLQRCRPYIAMDATHLTGRSRGQLAAAVAVSWS